MLNRTHVPILLAECILYIFKTRLVNILLLLSSNNVIPQHELATATIGSLLFYSYNLDIGVYIYIYINRNFTSKIIVFCKTIYIYLYNNYRGRTCTANVERTKVLRETALHYNIFNCRCIIYREQRER